MRSNRIQNSYSQTGKWNIPFENINKENKLTGYEGGVGDVGNGGTSFVDHSGWNAGGDGSERVLEETLGQHVIRQADQTEIGPSAECVAIAESQSESGQKIGQTTDN